MTGITGPYSYRTVQGDTVDRIAWQLYGSSAMAVEILAVNRHLAAHGAVLPAGLLLTLPPKKAATVKTWSLW